MCWVGASWSLAWWLRYTQRHRSILKRNLGVLWEVSNSEYARWGCQLCKRSKGMTELYWSGMCLQTADSRQHWVQKQQETGSLFKEKTVGAPECAPGEKPEPCEEDVPFFQVCIAFVSTGEAREAAQLSCFQHKHSFLVCIKHHEWVIFSTPFQNILFSISPFFSMMLWERSKTSSLVSLAAFCCCFKPQPKFKPWPRRGN